MPTNNHGGSAPSFGNVQKIIVKTTEHFLNKRRIQNIKVIRMDGSSMNIGGWDPYWTESTLYEALAEWYGGGIPVEFVGRRLKD